ncbi:MAG: MoaD/ThiS family protein, partial [Armatimonadota bacterium]|nr:MoaD/ThiS family protein [Armatimonadota bacterium]MDR5702399.1 MoaD/ThiS family protein [Armatimonadota bacterium]MDR7435593.1 MoaD/ThiS family protein [Armatimonadota bacterium]
MKVILHNPRREVEIQGRRRVEELLRELGLNPEAFLVIRGDGLLTRDMEIGEEDVVEVRPVVSGGAGVHGVQAYRMRWSVRGVGHALRQM